MPHWFKVGNMRNLLIETEEVPVGADDLAVLDGTVMLRGTLEDQHLTALQAALVEALVKILAPIAGLSLPWSRDDEACLSRAPCSVGVSQGTRPSKAIAEFNFKVMLGDPNDLPAALELLKLEARLGGAKRLLPQLTRSLGEVAGRLSLHLDVLPQDNPVAAPRWWATA